jgi:hypothetical protein
MDMERLKMIKIQTANNISNLFYKVMPTLSYLRIPSKTLISEGIMEIKPYSKEAVLALRSSFEALNVKYEEVEE